MPSKAKVAVYDLKQAEKVQGKWSKSFSTVKRANAKVSDVFVKEYNKNFEVSGSYYELNKEATEEYKAKVTEKSKG